MLQSSFELPKLISYEVMYEVSGILSTWNKLAAPVFNSARTKFILLGANIYQSA